MRHYRWPGPIVAVIFVCALPALSGCGRSAPSTPSAPPAPFRGKVDVRWRSIGPMQDSHAGKRAGVDYAMVHYLTWDDRIVLLVWADNENENYSAAATHPTHEGAEGVYEVTLDKVPVKYRTTDGKTGPLSVAGRDLNISDGWLVLVSTAGGQARVKQLQREVLKVQPDIEGGNRKDFEKLASDPEVVAFYRDKK